MVGKRCPNCDALLPARSSVCLRCSHAQPSPVPSKLKLRRGKNPLQRLSLAENAALAFNSGMATSTTPAGKQVSLAMTGSAPSVRPRGHRFLRPRFMIPAVVLCLILAVVGGYVIRINMAFNTINSVSTPADELSGEALGGWSVINLDHRSSQDSAGCRGRKPWRRGSGDCSPTNHLDRTGEFRGDRLHIDADTNIRTTDGNIGSAYARPDRNGGSRDGDCHGDSDSTHRRSDGDPGCTNGVTNRAGGSAHGHSSHSVADRASKEWRFRARRRHLVP